MNGPERAEPLIAARMATRRRKSRLKFTCVRAHWNRERKKLVDQHLARRSPRHSLARIRTLQAQVAESPCRVRETFQEGPSTKGGGQPEPEVGDADLYSI
jgi:hypothetical protein